MGRNYSFQLVGQRRDADRLIRALADHLRPDHRTRLLNAHAHGVERMLDHFERSGEGERKAHDGGSNAACLSFLFAQDEPLRHYASGPPPLSVIDGRVPIGCVWTSVACGSESVLVVATAATSGMSGLFWESPSIRSAFADIGRDGGAALVALDWEEGALRAVWPYDAAFTPASYEDEDFTFDAPTFDVDAYCADAVGAARLARDS